MGGPWTAAVAVDALTRPQRLGQAADRLPTAPTGSRLIVVSTRGWGNFPIRRINARFSALSPRGA